VQNEGRSVTADHIRLMGQPIGSPEMSANVELVEQFVDAFNRRDLDRFLALCHHEIELATPRGDTLRGHEGAVGWATKLWDGNTPAEVETDLIEEDGDRVVHHGRLIFRWRETGDVAEWVPVRAVFTLDAGMVIRWEGGPTDDFQP
jgi:limonene-1,2-epoxide hydrolase